MSRHRNGHTLLDIQEAKQTENACKGINATMAIHSNVFDMLDKPEMQEQAIMTWKQNKVSQHTVRATQEQRRKPTANRAQHID